MFFISSIAKSNTDNSYPSTEYGNKCELSTFSKTFAKTISFLPDICLTLTVFHEFPSLFHDSLSKIFVPDFSLISLFSRCVATPHRYIHSQTLIKAITHPPQLTSSPSLEESPVMTVWSSVSVMAATPANIFLKCFCSRLMFLLLPMISSRSSSPTK